MPATAKIFLSAGFTLAVASSCGRWFLLRTGVWDGLDRAERILLSFGIGSALLSTVVFAVCTAQLAYAPMFAVIGVMLLYAGFRPRSAAAPPALVKPAGRLLLLFAVPYAFLYLVNALAPEISSDGAGYHLGVVARYLREHGFSRITTDMYTMLSQGAELLFLFAFAFGRHSAAKVIHLAFLLGTVGLLISFARRFELGSSGAVAAAFFAISPVVGADGTAAYNDCALAFFTFLTFYLLLLWDQTRSHALWPAIGVAAGFCFSIKYTGFLAVPFAVVFLAAKAKPDRLRAVLTVVCFAALFIAPWLIKNAIVVGNPVAPFFNRFFPNPYVHVSFEQLYGFYMRHYEGLGEHNWRDYLSLPWELAVSGATLQGLLGPLFLLAPLGLWSLRRRMGRIVWIAAVVFALPWFTNIGARFLIPSLVFVSLGMALAIRQAPSIVPLVLIAAHAVISWPAVIPHWNHRSPWRIESMPWRAAFRLEPEDRYITRLCPPCGVARMIERIVRPGARVLSPDAVAQAYTSREALVSYQCGTCEVLMDHLLTAVIPDLGPVSSVRFEWPARELTGLRLVQTASHPQQMWSIHELLLFAGEIYYVPKPSWIIRARPNPWDGALAMDGNPATRWRTWWPLYPGMSYQIEFPETLRLSAVELHCSEDQPQVALDLHAKDKTGRWSRIKAKETRFNREPLRDEMKKLATSELKDHGIGYILTDLQGGGMNLIAPHIAKDPAAWGLREVGQLGTAHLYEIE